MRGLEFKFPLDHACSLGGGKTQASQDGAWLSLATNVYIICFLNGNIIPKHNTILRSLSSYSSSWSLILFLSSSSLAHPRVQPIFVAYLMVYMFSGWVSGYIEVNAWQNVPTIHVFYG